VRAAGLIAVNIAIGCASAAFTHAATAQSRTTQPRIAQKQPPPSAYSRAEVDQKIDQLQKDILSKVPSRQELENRVATASYVRGSVSQRFPGVIPDEVDKLFGDWKDWLVGLVVGFLGGVVVVGFLHYQVPKIEISREIRLKWNGRGTREHQAIKVTNKRSRWFFNHDAIDIRAELHLVTRVEEGGHEHVEPIELVRHDPLIIPQRQRWGREPGASEYIFRIAKIGSVGSRREPDAQA
jgi:hypothetical protein